MPRPPLRRFAVRPAGAWPARRPALAAATMLAAGALTAGGSAAPAGASQRAAAAHLAGHPAGHPAIADPYSPAYRHSYRRGVVAAVGRLGRMREWANQQGTGDRAITASDLCIGRGRE